jgi:Skp family chaperone for outer membrane proteins
MRHLFRPIVTTLFIFVILAGKLPAQTSAGTGSNKSLNVAVINSLVFEDNARGVTKLLNTRKRVEAEFKPRIDELSAQEKKLNDIKTKIEKTPSQNDPKLIEEGERLQRDFLYKREEYQAKYNKRYQELMGPVYAAMATAAQQWCKQKGYDMLFDLSKDDKGIIVWVEESKINELTIDLIKHFNTVL